VNNGEIKRKTNISLIRILLLYGGWCTDIKLPYKVFILLVVGLGGVVGADGLIR